MVTKEDFSLDYAPGDKITVVLGNGNLIWSGELSELGERRFKLTMSDGTVRSISYDGVLADYASPAEEAVVQTPAPEGTPDEADGTYSLLREGILAVRDAEYIWEFDPASLKEQIRLSPNTDQKRIIMTLADNLAEAELVEDFDTIDKIVVAGETLIAKEPDNLALLRLVGEAALLAENFEKAEDILFTSENYGEAFYAAWASESRDKMADDGACHLLYEKKKCPEIVEMYVKQASDAGDLSVFKKFLETEGKEHADLVGCCLAYLLARKKIYPKLSSRSLSADENYDMMKQLFLENYPDPVNSQLEQMERADEEESEEATPYEPPMVTLNSFSLPETSEEPIGRREIAGTIFSYKPDQKIGFIRAEDADWFFHVNHIADPELEPMLEEDPEGQYLVYFDEGHNSRGSCAVNVRIRDKAHPKEEPDPELLREHQGIITRYYPFYSNGQITEGENTYNFRLSFITDPALHNYCEIYQDILQRRFEVFFHLKKLKDGKLVATDIRLTRPLSEQVSVDDQEYEESKNFAFGIPVPVIGADCKKDEETHAEEESTPVSDETVPDEHPSDSVSEVPEMILGIPSEETNE